MKIMLIAAIVGLLISCPALARKHNHTDGLNQVGDPAF